MISSIRIKNYKCLRDLNVALKPLTVVIGKNDTGKSSFLEALHTLAGLVSPESLRLEGPWSIDKLAFRGADPPEIEWTAEIAPSPRNRLPGKATYSLRIVPRGAHSVTAHVDKESISVDGASVQIEYDARNESNILLKEGKFRQHLSIDRAFPALSVARGMRGLNTINAVSRALSTTIKYRLEPGRLSQASLHEIDPNEPEREPRLAHDGYGLPSVLDYLLGARRDAFTQIERDLREALPFIKSVQLKPWAVQGKPGKSVSFELSSSGYDISAPLASDSVMLFLAYLTLLHSPSTPAVLLLEEPENGIHPRQLPRIAEYLKQLTDPGRGPNAAQIVVATHSPYFLDFVPPESVLAFGRKESGETVAVPLLSLPGVQKRLESGFSLGEMWFKVGEDELLAEVLR